MGKGEGSNILKLLVRINAGPIAEILPKYKASYRLVL